MKRNILLTIIFIVLGLLVSGCTSTTETGLLQGEVVIGPISPVEQPGEDTELNCEVYAARKIMIYDESGDNLLMQVDIDCDVEENYAGYSLELEAGIYTVDINHIGIDSSSDVPKQVEIVAGSTYILDIDIDTGIR